MVKGFIELKLNLLKTSTVMRQSQQLWFLLLLHLVYLCLDKVSTASGVPVAEMLQDRRYRLVIAAQMKEGS